MSGVINSLRRFLTANVAKTIVAIVTSWTIVTLPCSTSRRYQSCRMARVVTNYRFCHITPLLKSLHWIPVRYRLKFKWFSMIYYALISPLCPPPPFSESRRALTPQLHPLAPPYRPSMPSHCLLMPLHCPLTLPHCNITRSRSPLTSPISLKRFPVAFNEEKTFLTNKNRKQD